MHLAGDGRFVGQSGFLFERQRIHVGAQPDDFAGLAAADDRDDARLSDAGDDFIAAEALSFSATKAAVRCSS